MKALDILIQAREKISTPDKWTKEAAARSADGDRYAKGSSDLICRPPLSVQSTDACSWCSVGAIGAVANRFYHDDGGQEQNKAINALNACVPESFQKHLTTAIVKFNDHPDTSHQMVMEVFDKAIQRLQDET